MERDYSFGGDILQARFGHTLTPIGKDRAVVFGGAVGDTGSNFLITQLNMLLPAIHSLLIF